MVENIKKVICDRCGAECSHFIEKTFKLKGTDGIQVYEKKFSDNYYFYTEVIMQGKRDNFECQKDRFDLCPQCMLELSEWLKKEGAK